MSALLSLHLARACPCGGGKVFRLGDASGGGRSPPLIAECLPLVCVPTELREYLVPRRVIADAVTCPWCGAWGWADHLVVCRDGVPVGADSLRALALGGELDHLGRASGPAEN